MKQDWLAKCYVYNAVVKEKEKSESESERLRIPLNQILNICNNFDFSKFQSSLVWEHRPCFNLDMAKRFGYWSDLHEILMPEFVSQKVADDFTDF